MRIKNYGSIINVAIGGILYKGLVVGIVSSTFVRVEIMDERGNIVQNDYQLENLKALNPSDLEEEKLINEFAGFENVGNVCFINSVLQCLIRTPLFGAYL